ncbi:MAG TPA: nickel-dependent lactate racemase [Bacteroidetes bacterium]|nr:nickel-dependent lactate racemase [Bacteroidota bacterium]
MKVELPWGHERLQLELPETWEVVVPKRREVPRVPPDQLEVVRRALHEPADMPPLRALDLRGKKVVVIVDDNTRPTPTSRFFHLLLDELEEAGAEPGRTTVIAALGIHTPMTEEEMAAKIGAENLKRVRWVNHQAFDPAELVQVGITSRGNPMVVNRRVAEADFVISVGMIEPHLWAGFGGGLKNIFPGVAGAEAIGQHHNLIAEPPYAYNRVGWPPEHNSFRQDLEEIGGMLRAPVFILNVVIDHKQNILAAFAGDPIAAHRQGIAFNNAIAGLEMKEKVDGVITCSYPMDINFKQSMKGVGNVLPALRPGGVVMAFLRAERGIDDITLPEKSAPLWLVKRILRFMGPGKVMGFLDRVKKGLNVEERFLTYYSMQLIREHDLFFYVPTLSEEEVKKLGFFVQCSSPQEVVARGAKKLGKRAKIAVFPEGGATFPLLQETDG